MLKDGTLLVESFDTPKSRDERYSTIMRYFLQLDGVFFLPFAKENINIDSIQRIKEGTY